MTRLRLTRILSELSLHSVAKATGLDATELSRLERRLIEPTPRMIRALERHFGTSVTDLLAEASATV